MGYDTDKSRLEQRNRELSILNTIANALNSSVKLNDALQAALEHVAGLLDLHTGWVWLLREESEASYLAAALNLPPALSHKPQRMEGTCYCLDTYRSGDLAGAANVNVIECTRLNKLVDGTDGLRYHASIPLYAHGKKLGVLNVASQDWRELSPDDLRLLYTVGDLLSIAVERARLFEASRQLGAVEERNRLAREIHDTIAQGMTAVTLHLESAEALLETGVEPERVQRAIRQALLLTRANLEEARRSVLDLRAAPLEGRTLGEALAELCQSLQPDSRANLSFQATGDRPLSPPSGSRAVPHRPRSVEQHPPPCPGQFGASRTAGNTPTSSAHHRRQWPRLRPGSRSPQSVWPDRPERTGQTARRPV
ncbi:MAG: GAF domain-containing protein [Chloroflexi bacterium]|nr:GAF domain-containing protein [Chloroflexota bacterium]